MHPSPAPSAQSSTRLPHAHVPRFFGTEIDGDDSSNPATGSSPHSIVTSSEPHPSTLSPAIPNPYNAPRSTPFLYEDHSASTSVVQSPLSPTNSTPHHLALMTKSKDRPRGISAARSEGHSASPGGLSTDVAGDSHQPRPASQGHSAESTPETPANDHKTQTRSEELPSWAGHKTKAGKERKRLPLACIACRRKKIRCSGEKPVCKHCARSRIPCVYKVTTRKAAPRTDYMAMLDKRLKRMEERVIKIMPKDDQRNLPAIGRSVVKPTTSSSSATTATAKKQQADQAFADNLYDWAKLRPGFERQSTTPQPPPVRDQSHSDIISDGSEHLPSYELQEHLTEIYFEYVYGQAYHLLHKPTYLKRLRASQVPAVLNLAVCAVSARFSTHPHFGSETPYLRGEQWAAPARQICLRRYDTPNLTIIMAYLLLGLHEFGTCHGGRSWMFGGMAQRMAYALQLHKNLDPEQYNFKGSEGRKLPQTDRETRLRTMWACFMMDRFNSSGTDRPPFVAEQYIEVRLPIKENLYIMEVAGPTEQLDPAKPHTDEAHDNMGCSAYMVRIIAIWGDVVRYMNLGGKDRDMHPIWHTSSGFHGLAEHVERFKTTLPAELRWGKDNLATHACESTANQYIFMHIVLQQTTLFLNRFALPVPGSPTTLPSETPQEFINKCVRDALDAANQTSLLISEAHRYRVVAPFAGYCAYYASTVLLHGLSSRSTAVIEASKQALATNIKYLIKLRTYWGMFYHVTENLKDMFRSQTEARTGGPRFGKSSQGPEKPVTLFQYGDWFEKYPNGVQEAKPKTPTTVNTGASSTSATKSSQDVNQSFAFTETQQSPSTDLPGADLPVAVAANASKRREQKRKRVKSLGVQPAEQSHSPSNILSPVDVSGPSSGQNTTDPSPGHAPPAKLVQQRSYPEVEMAGFRPSLPRDTSAGFGSAMAPPRHAQQQFSPTDTQFMPNMQHAILDFMSNQSIMNQDPHSLISPGLGHQQQPQHRQGLISDLDRQMVLSSYTGMDSVCGPPGQEQGNVVRMDHGLVGGQNMLMSAVGFPNSTDVNMQAPMASTTSEGFGNVMVPNAPGNNSSAWFMPFNFDPRSTGPSASMAQANPAMPLGMDISLDLDAVLGGYSGYSHDLTVMEKSVGLGSIV